VTLADVVNLRIDADPTAMNVRDDNTDVPIFVA
jgi:hypothetical protein